MKTPSRRVTPRELTTAWEKMWNRHAAAWMAGDGDWPRSWTLHAPTEAEVRADFDGTARWIASWRSWSQAHGAATALQWETRQWRGLGIQELPSRIICAEPGQLADWLGLDAPWRRATERFARLSGHHPALAPALRRDYAVLAQADEIDHRRMESLLEWLLAHPFSGLYPRQLPIAGLDTKWLNTGRRRRLRDWLQHARGDARALRDENPPASEPVQGIDEPAVLGVDSFTDAAVRSDDASDRGGDFFTVGGLRREPSFLHIRVLDPRWRREVGGLSLLQTPPEEAARLSWAPGSVLVVENLTTGWALEDLTDTVAIVGCGYAVDMLAGLPWLRGSHIGYWGDIDTHGFGILGGFRSYFPDAQSLMMDMETLATHRALCVEEASPHAAVHMPGLSRDEAAVYAYLKQHPGLRLEQERIAWNYAWPRLIAWVQGVLER